MNTKLLALPLLLHASSAFCLPHFPPHPGTPSPSRSCMVQLGTTGEPCASLPSRPNGPVFPGVECTFYPRGVAQVQLDLQNEQGSAVVIYDGQHHRLNECELTNPANGAFSCAGMGFVVHGSRGGELYVKTSDGSRLSGYNPNCY